jgi:hypothetical protein
VGFLASCVVESDPASPCGELDLGDAEPATMVARSQAPIVAVSTGAGGESPFVLHHQCEDEHQTGCTLRKTNLPLTPGSALMLTADGHWVVAVDPQDRVVRTWSVHPTEGLVDGREDLLGQHGPRRLVASLRNSSLVIVRDIDGDPGNLARFDPETGRMETIASAELGLSVAAVGEQHVIGRRIRGDGLEELYVVVADAEVSRFADFTNPMRLIRGRPFSRVVLTAGDARVVATSGQGNDAETFVFAVSDGTLLDRFAGEAITGRRALEDIPGMRAASPDGSHIAYRTPNGAIALRNVDSHGACMVRSANAGAHTLAGFSADGLLYIESESSVGRTHVHAFDPATRRLHPLGGTDYARSMRLAAVPGGDDRASPPWAIGANNGSYYALQPGEAATGLKLGQPLFMPRDDASIWAVNTVRQAAGHRAMTLRRIMPNGNDHTFSVEQISDVEYVPEGEAPRTFAADVASLTCLSTGMPGSWGTQCGLASSSSFLAGTPIPPAEDPYDSGARLEPEVPELPE